jgi:nitroreductase
VPANVQWRKILRSSIDEIVKRRYSCRTYVDRPIEATDRQTLSEFLASLGAGPLGSRTRLSLVAATEQDRESLKGLGTYGFIKGAAGFIVGAVEPGPRDMEDYGYRLEQAVLASTDLGLGTCWLGGSFTKSSFARKIGATRSEVVPAVVAVGYATEGSRNTRIRQRAGSDRRLPPEQLFSEEGLREPLDLPSSGAYADVLEAVRWAPSASNKQPWRVVRSGETWHFYLQRTKGYGKGSPVFSLLRLADLQRVDMGIAMCHFELAARGRGLAGRWVVERPGIGTMGEGLEYTVSWIAEVG